MGVGLAFLLVNVDEGFTGLVSLPVVKFVVGAEQLLRVEELVLARYCYGLVSLWHLEKFAFENAVDSQAFLPAN